MKLIAFAFVTFLVVDCYVQSAVLRSGALPHNLYECDETKPKVRVLQEIVRRPGRAQTVINEAIQFPRFPDPFSTTIVSCVIAEDLNRNGKVGYAEIVAGGVGYSFVSITFESQAGEDIQFAVTIYVVGSPANTTIPYGHATPEP